MPDLALKEIEIPSGKKLKSTFSAGVAVWTEGKDTIAAADEALYRAKNTGRNCVEVSGEVEVPGEADIPPALRSTPPFQRPCKVSEVRFATRVLTVCSPWTPGAGVTSMVIASAEELVRRRIAVAVIDADFKRPELATRFGLPAEEMWKYDWRYGSAALRLKKNLYVFPLDVMTKPPPVSDQINDVIRMAQEIADLVIIDAGDDPEFSAPGGRLLVVDERKTTSDVIKAWEFYKPFSQGAVLLRGSGSDGSFGMPLLGMFTPGDINSQVKALLDSWNVKK